MASYRIWSSIVAFTVVSTTATGALLAQSAQLPLSGNGTLQSSYAYSGTPARAIDGNTSPYYSSSSCTHTAIESDPYWSVGLGDTRDVDRVVIYNRLDDTCSPSVDPFHDVCNPGVFGGKRWYCAADPDLHVGSSCPSVWEECQPGCNPGKFAGEWWRCPENPEIHTGYSCPTVWRMCEPSDCATRIDGIEVYVGEFVSDPAVQQISSNPPQFIGGGGYDDIRQYLDGVHPTYPAPTLCGGPVYVGPGQQTVTVDCPAGTTGEFIYIIKKRDNAVLTLCEVEAYGG